MLPITVLCSGLSSGTIVFMQRIFFLGFSSAFRTGCLGTAQREWHNNDVTITWPSRLLDTTKSTLFFFFFSNLTKCIDLATLFGSHARVVCPSAPNSQNLENRMLALSTTHWLTLPARLTLVKALDKKIAGDNITIYMVKPD